MVAGTVDGNLVRGFEAHGPLDTTVKGWYIDLLTPPSGTAEGERITNRPLVAAPC